ncbi:Undecaprenyl-phosphate galactose phosphotransferase, WbaP/exopolysaccharide biosynthesis polyprenyl glycosylphosphotransferase [Amycolatopsis xylanica]|uniref:Undecaprenyl-phosphate galactose phosphotransferase, WbaP/exopolysaccharide biosynthesis polyprenyl glycosylphosphotransferase n=1 Tax=Amycolatopsis xylanica TaxID=589385 RepID=A0A1H2SN38_9PSEU|nr:sugar transferase [Amycolatopsis xylanica]SDW33073.1 Undecaprenyl-phosphate galactose phosphotransferase, WbaP/exopolysaccharide biosynthesis polyprenyl glycosylphosphotransferase [Amycolatopsis xylanica]
MEESVRSSSPVGEATPHIDLRQIPRPAKRTPRAVVAEDSSRKTPSTAWEAHYRAWVIGADVLATLVVIAISAAIIDKLELHNMHAIGTIAAVLCALPASRAWSQRVLGEGAEEYRRLGRGLVTAAVLVALGGLLFGALDVQPWVFIVVPVIALITFPQRYLLRQVLHRQRRQGRCLLPVMAAGAPDTVADLIGRTRTEPHVGWRVEAACTFSGTGAERDTGEVDGVPVVGRLDELAEHVRRGGYRVVAVTADQYWTPQRLQQLAWDLEGTSAEMVVAPVLMEVAGPRLNVSSVLGMPLLRVTAPRFTGGRRLVKEFVDRCASALLLTVLSPLLLMIALAIKLNDRGPVIYKQRRIGRDGASFTMFKFRTMITDADKVRKTLEKDNEGAGPLFKMRKDPRITKVGSMLRRYSLDELPQLFNVLYGRMSLVGPRPPLPEETKKYGSDARRRLLVKPGLTGLWQVSGRSDLTWDQSIRLDLRYVEDWSLALDMVILWKTVRAVVGGEGAY